MDMRKALEEELAEQNMTVKELASRSGIPLATLYKVTSGDRDVRFSTVKRIAAVLEPRRRDFIAVIAAKFLLEKIEGEKMVVGKRELTTHGYSANSIEECIVAAVRAQKDGAAGIVCAPILASVIEKIVDIPVAIMKPRPKEVLESIEWMAKRI